VKEPKNPLVLYALARFYDDYAFTGILDPDIEKANRDRAIATYKQFLQQDPNHSEAWISIGRLMFRGGQWEEAAEWFRHALERGWNVRTMILWYFECLYRLGDFRALRRGAAEYGRGIINQETVPQEVRDAVALWQQVA
jgi:tetratricopeptide (TPR) repeat protein